MSSSSPPRVIVAEDEALIRLDLVEMLQDEGYDVIAQTDNGMDAITLAEQHQPDLVLLDIKMPKLDGIAAAEKIAGTGIAPVVIMTAFSQRDLVEQARDAGAMAYLVKPVNQSDLVPAIEVALSRHEEVREIKEQLADVTDQLAARKVVDRAKSLLQTSLGLSEPDAFRWIQRTAMDLRQTMKEVSEGIIEHGAPGEKN